MEFQNGTRVESIYRSDGFVLEPVDDQAARIDHVTGQAAMVPVVVCRASDDQVVWVHIIGPGDTIRLIIGPGDTIRLS